MFATAILLPLVGSALAGMLAFASPADEHAKVVLTLEQKRELALSLLR